MLGIQEHDLYVNNCIARQGRNGSEGEQSFTYVLIKKCVSTFSESDLGQSDT